MTVGDQHFCPTCRAAYPVDFAACPRDGSRLGDGKDPLVGVELRDTYRITHVIGEGGLGRVYHASHLRMPRSYAVKVPRGVFVDHPKSRARLFNEAIAAGRLNHPNVVGVLDVGETGGLPYLLMDFAQGEPLSQRLVGGAIPVRDALGIVHQLLRGLAHAHAHGVVHRDLKPDNIMIHAGHVRILDFGIAILLDLGEEGRFTTKGMTIGTPHYMAPEQLLGTVIDPRSDLYAVGAILYELIAGCRPFGGNMVDYVHHVVADPLPTFAERVPGLEVDPRVEDLCRRLMARDRSERPVDADAALARLSEIDPDLSQRRARADSERARQVIGLPRLPSPTFATEPTVASGTVETTDQMRVRWWNPRTWIRRTPRDAR